MCDCLLSAPILLWGFFYSGVVLTFIILRKTITIALTYSLLFTILEVNCMSTWCFTSGRNSYFQHLSHREYWICYINKVKASFTFTVLTEYTDNHAFIFCTYLIFNFIPNSVESLLFDKVYYKFFFLILCHHA